MAKLVSTGKTISTSEYLAKRNKERQKRRIIGTALILLILIGLLIVSRLPQFQIKSVVVTGAPATGADAVKAEIEKALAGTYVWLVPHSNALLYRKDNMKAALALAHPRFSRIDISLEGLETLTVDVDEREPYALYCESEEKCWFLDKEGFIFDRAPSFSDGVYFIYTLAEPLSSPQGERYLPQGEFGKLKSFVSALEPLGFEPFTLEASSQEFKIRMKSGSELLLSRDEELPVLLANLSAFLQSPAIKAEKDFLARVASLDLRTKDRVFYHFKQNSL